MTSVGAARGRSCPVDGELEGVYGDVSRNCLRAARVREEDPKTAPRDLALGQQRCLKRCCKGDGRHEEAATWKSTTGSVFFDLFERGRRNAFDSIRLGSRSSEIKAQTTQAEAARQLGIARASICPRPTGPLQYRCDRRVQSARRGSNRNLRAEAAKRRVTACIETQIAEVLLRPVQDAR
jgi:hypothetical protein